MIVWIIGISGSGKSTLAKSLYNKVRVNNKSTVWIDGDMIRSIFAFNKETNYNLYARKDNFKRIYKLCKLLDEQHINVICSFLNIFPKFTFLNKHKFSSYYEIFINSEINEIRNRYKECIYNLKKNNLVGMDIKFKRPINPDFEIINNSSKLEFLKFNDIVFNDIKNKLL